MVVTSTWLYLGMVAIVLSLAATRFMIRVNISDVPNERSSHAKPTPKSGGVAVAFAFLFLLIGIFLTQDNAVEVFAISTARLFLYAGLVFLIVGVSLIDDLWEVLPASKLAAQLIAATFFAIFITRIDFIFIPGIGEFDLGIWGYLLTILWIVFFVNAYNFMDGINGIAGAAALIGGFFLAAIAFFVGAFFVTLCSFAIALSVLGFLYYNFPGGRIFMGDAGSQFIGFVLASLAVFGTSLDQAQLSIYVVPVIFLPFVFDVIVTLVYRSLRRQNIMKAHSEHLYQIGTKLGYSHFQVTLIYSFLFVLCGIAGAIVQFSNPGGRLVVIAGMIAIFSGLAGVVYSAGLRCGVVEPTGLLARSSNRARHKS